MFVVYVPFAHAGVCPVITKYLAVGSRDGQVIPLKKYLIQEGYLSGVSLTTYFGPSTETALKAWQRKKGIVSSGTPKTTGYGATGPNTRRALTACTDTYIAPVVSVVKKEEKKPVSTKKCKVTGCSSQFCVDSDSPEIASTCEYKEEYACYKERKCEVQSDGACSWSAQEDINKCVAKARGSLCIPPVCPAPPKGCAYVNPTWCSCGVMQCKTDSPTCRFNGMTIPDQGKVEAFEKQEVEQGTTCDSVREIRTCDNGFLAGTYQYSSCRIKP
jgi:hypothetical protein